MTDTGEQRHPPQVSVIIPCYNAGDKIKRTLESVLVQEGVQFECLIIDGKSDKETTEVFGPFLEDSRFRVFSEPDNGIYDAMNKGIARANGKYVYFIGAGDKLRSNILLKIWRFIEKTGFPELAYGDVFWCTLGIRYGGRFDPRLLLRRNICHQSIFYERAVFDILGPYSARYRSCADYEKNLQIFGSISMRKIHVNEIVADYEGGGFSEKPDCPFTKDFPILVARNLGLARLVDLLITVRAYDKLRNAYHKLRARLAGYRHTISRPNV